MSTIKELMENMEAMKVPGAIIGHHTTTGVSFEMRRGRHIDVYGIHQDAPSLNIGTRDPETNKMTVAFGPVAVSRAVARLMKDHGF